METPLYKRVLLKLSGEALMSRREFGIDPDTLNYVAAEVISIRTLGVEVGLVIGGGNIYRGAATQAIGVGRVTGDYMGMLATVINAMALQDCLEGHGADTRVMSAMRIDPVAEPYIRRRALRHLEKGRIVIFAAGTGNPYFTTDTAAALRAMEVQAQVLIKATKVDGVYSDDPLKKADAVFFPEISYIDVLTRDLKILDTTATVLCKNSNVPIVVFNLYKAGELKRLVCGEKVGTRIHAKEGV